MDRIWIIHTGSAVFTVPISMILFTGTAGIMILSTMIHGITLHGIHHIGHIPWAGAGEAAGILPTTAGDGEVSILHTPIITIPGTVHTTLLTTAGGIRTTHGMDMEISGISIPKTTATGSGVLPIPG